MTDEKPLVSDSSSDAGNLTGADVDFDSFQANRLAERLGKTAEPAKEPDPKPVVADTAPADKGKAPVSEPADEPKPTPSLTREEVTREIDARLAATKPEPKKEEPKADPYPTLADPQFKTVEECEAAQAAWVERRQEAAIAKALEARDKARETERTQQSELETKRKDWEGRENDVEFRKRVPDYDDLKKIGASRPFNETALQYIVDSKVGPDLFVHYVKNEQDWKDLIALQPEEIRLEMRLVEREIRRSMAAAPVAPKGKTVSDASPPLEMLGGQRSAADDPREKAAQEGDVDAYHAARNAERARDRLGRFN